MAVAAFSANSGYLPQQSPVCPAGHPFGTQFGIFSDAQLFTQPHPPPQPHCGGRQLVSWQHGLLHIIRQSPLFGQVGGAVLASAIRRTVPSTNANTIRISKFLVVLAFIQKFSLQRPLILPYGLHERQNKIRKSYYITFTIGGQQMFAKCPLSAPSSVNFLGYGDSHCHLMGE